MRSARITMKVAGAATAALISLPMVALPAHAEPVGLTGTITDQGTGSPLPGACLSLFQHIHDGPPGPEQGRFCADAQGRYLVTGVGTQNYAIRVDAAGHRTEWLYRAPDHLNAAAVSIPAGGLVTQDIALGVGAGTVKGRLTDAAGAPADVRVDVTAVDGSWSAFAYTWDLGDGRYEIPNVPPGDYRVMFDDNDHAGQWVPQQESPDTATVFHVVDGGTVVADDSWLPQGTVEVTIRDAETGGLVPRPCATIHGAPTNQGSACGTNGVVRLADIPPGDWEFSYSGGASYFYPTETEYVTVRRGETTRLTRTLRPASAVVTNVVDAAGAPVGGICVHIVEPATGGQSAHMGQQCSDTTGRLELGPYDGGGSFQLYAFQSQNPYQPPAVRYGDQWVGAQGGTGDQRKALLVTLKQGKTITIPTIKVDPPGTITGIVRDRATGLPVPGICAFPYALHPGQGWPSGKHCADATGRYTIDDVGPYEWPVEYIDGASRGYGWQWSGDQPHRFAARYTKVTAGGTATVDAKVATGGALTVTVTGVADATLGYGWTHNAVTGDIAGSWTNFTSPQPFTLKNLATQQVYVQLWVGDRYCWYGSSQGRRPRATAVPVTAGQTVDLTARMWQNCAPALPALTPRRPAVPSTSAKAAGVAVPGTDAGAAGAPVALRPADVPWAQPWSWGEPTAGRRQLVKP